MSHASELESKNTGPLLVAHRRTLVVAAISGLGLRLPDLQATDARKRNKRRKRRKKKPGAPQGAPPPLIQVAASCTIASSESAGASPPQRLAQTFTAAVNGSLVRADVSILKLPDSFGDYFLHLGRVDNFGVPTNEVLAVASVANPDVPEGSSTVTFTFPNPVALTAGARFALVLTRTGTDTLLWLAIAGDQCGGEGFRSVSQTAPFTRFNDNSDLLYTVFVQ